MDNYRVVLLITLCSWFCLPHVETSKAALWAVFNETWVSCSEMLTLDFTGPCKAWTIEDEATVWRAVTAGNNNNYNDNDNTNNDNNNNDKNKNELYL